MNKLILFDLDDTLYATTTFAEKARRFSLDVLQHELTVMGYKFDFDFLYDNFMKIYQQDKNSDHIFDDLIRDVLKVKEFEIAKLVSLATYSYSRIKKTMTEVEGATEILENLKKRFVIGVASSGKSVKQWDKMIRLGLDDFFKPELVFITETLKLEKSVEFYEKVLQKIDSYGLKFDEIYMVGDIEKHDIIPAKQAGLTTIRLKSTDRNNDFKTSNADIKIENLKELKKLVYS